VGKGVVGVLLVEDEPHAREDLLSYDWEAMGARVVGVADHGARALSLCASLQPHLMLCDITMPLLDGLQTLEALRKTGSSTLVALLTCHRSFEYAKRAVALGALDYIEKMELDESILRELIQKVARQTRIPLLSGETGEPVNGTLHPEVDRAIRLIRHDYATDLTLKQVAESVHLSPSYFSALFHSETGQTFNEYVTGVRIEHAVHLLSSTDLKVYEVAERVGIPNYRYFTQVFKRICGVSPIAAQKKTGPRST